MLISAILLRQNVGDIIVNSGLLGVTVLLIIVLLSVVSWAITLDKMRTLRRGARQTRRFLKILPRDFSILEARQYARGSERSSLARIMVEASTAVESEVAGLKRAGEPDVAAIVQAAKAAMERAAVGVVDEMESKMIFLATTASACPFLGLFGTVWGVMISFLSMGNMGSASLSVVGPGVATALIATIFGLGAAIPALVAYNYFVNRVRREQVLMESFISRVAESITKEIHSEIHASNLPV
jgi:biopolymer transport protein TolQ